MGQPRALYLGKERRPIHLTEQGLNSPDYSEKSLQEQAAGMAYAWNKMKRLPEIGVFDYHNWIDNRGGVWVAHRPAEVSRRARRPARAQADLVCLPSARHAD